jgi:transposase InsO family protein
MAPKANISELSHRFGISRNNGYKWLRRFAAEGRDGLAARSRRPLTSPARTDGVVESQVLRVRAESNNAWGGRKIAKVLRSEGWPEVPSPSTITEILRRHGKLEQSAPAHPGPWQRFERAQPNELWQMDYKGHIALLRGRCHPLTVIDDHSRYALGVEACGDEQDATVRERMTVIFRRYGMPVAMLADNGSPWGGTNEQPLTMFAVWLMRLGIRISHGRPYHPQTQGKEERFNRTLNAEVLIGCTFADLADCQVAFDRWRPRYNHIRPHEALGMATPDSRYRVSPRVFPERLPPIEYGPGDLVRKVDSDGCISFKNIYWRLGKPFRGQLVALRSTTEDGVFTAYFCTQAIATLDLRDPAASCGNVDIAIALPAVPQGAAATNSALIQS